MQRYEFYAIGTTWQITFTAETADTEKYIALIKERIAIFESNYSRFREDSFVGRIAKDAGTFELPSDAEKMLNFYQQLYTITSGKVTPLIGSVLVDAGYDKTYSLQSKETISQAKKWPEHMQYTAPFLTTTVPVQLDFGAVGKGYIVDIIAALLHEHNVQDVLINAGGDMYQHNHSGIAANIGLEDPDDTSRIIGVVELHNKSIAGSSGNRRAWSSHHHIIDPDSTQSPQHIAAVWVVADSTMVADGLTTALFFTDPETLLHHFNFEFLILYSDRTISRSNNFPAVLY